MKNTFGIASILFYFYIVCVECSGSKGFLDDEKFHHMLKDLSVNSFANSSIKLVFFQIKKKKKRNYELYMNYLYEFLLTTGVNSDIYNWNNQHYVAITKIDAEIDKDTILNRFKGVITNVGQQAPKDVIPGLQGKHDNQKPDL
jgi:hypothetical protein